jgi:hypothetical protein
VEDYASHAVIYTYSDEVARRLSVPGDETEGEIDEDEVKQQARQAGLQIKEPMQLSASGLVNAIEAQEPQASKEDNTVTINVKADKDTNGLVEVAYDDSVLKLESVNSLMKYNDKKASEGKVVIDFADANAHSGNIATLKFTYEPKEEDGETSVSITMKEASNDFEEKKEEFKVVLPGKGYPTEIEIEGKGEAEFEDGILTMQAEEGYTLVSVTCDGDELLKVTDASEGREEKSIAAEGRRIEVVYRPLNLEFIVEDNHLFWYEDAVRQGTEDDDQNITAKQFDGSRRGREIYDPLTDAWYWLDAIYGGAVAKDKEVWMPYIYQNEEIGSTKGKWVRYDGEGQMIKGWYEVVGEEAKLYPNQEGNKYYYDLQTGEMYHGVHVIDGESYDFNQITGALK